MTATDLVRAGGATLVFDTNAIVRPTRKDSKLSFTRFFRCCDAASRLRKAPQPLEVSVVVPALVHFEVLHDLRVNLRTNFHLGLIRANLESKGVRVEPFDGPAAEEASACLVGWFGEPSAWSAGKKQRCLQALGIKEAPGHGLATIDWPVAAHVEAVQDWILVTDDRGPEFRESSRKLTAIEVSTLLEALLVERGVEQPR